MKMRLIMQNAALLLALPLSFGPGVIRAYGAGGMAGTTGAQFLELPVGARVIAMGSAGGAVSRDATAIYYNPAGLAGLKETSVSLMQAFYFQTISYQFGALAGKLGDDDVYALGVQRLSAGEIKEIDNTGNVTGGALHPVDLAVTAAFGKKFGAVSAGLAGKYISSKIDGTASSVALDAGLKGEVSPGITLAGSLSNMGSGMRYGEVKNNLPATARAGAAAGYNNFIHAVDLIMPRGAKPYLAGGT